MRAGKKSVLARDVLEAVNELEFGEFLPRLEAELQSMSLVPWRFSDPSTRSFEF